ncbi:alpha-(1,6)-fucosyltransferase-like isoform X2 [Ruditapes philippinarum]|uniref:alpha-(1,6)-fucosyltransferase-like isoform X2 n=1 Tax=Ruditapes philippinarum TaxID=129788 RepID=UPI00295A82C0|nr:alpha-(1,6)-fucosyltransferase-like isoform X2 [Ruditapes philippinarum]
MYLGLLRIIRRLDSKMLHVLVTNKRIVTGTIMITVLSFGTICYNLQLQHFKEKDNASKKQRSGQIIVNETISNSSLNPTIDDYQQAAKIVQETFDTLQNPNDCNTTKSVLCEIPSNGFGHQVHLLTICFTVGFMTRRTVIIKTGGEHISIAVWGLFGTEDIQVIKANFQTNYFDLHRTLPSYISHIINHFHSNPSLWWAGQVAKFILRPNKSFEILIEKRKKELGFYFKTIGIYIETKSKEAQTRQYNLTNYKKFAEEWYRLYERKTGFRNSKRRIFIASDEHLVLTEATKIFSNYSILFNTNVNHSYALRSSLAGDIMLDTYMLSMCDYLICTMSSDICRLAFELLQSQHLDGSKLALSLDCPYFIDNLYRDRCKLMPTRADTFQNVIKNII